MKPDLSQYSPAEKILHNLAFGSWNMQVSLSDLESKFHEKDLSNINVDKPVFITGLPRAGTTILLEILVGTGEFASHSYRHMPFLLTPIFWKKFSKLFSSAGELKERAHGDGIMINFDSPEAFEEIIWKGFWPSRYLKDRIIPWSEPAYPEFEDFLNEHMRKIIFLQNADSSGQTRYISKNNLNISRINYLRSIFPDSVIIVPFRAPYQHASSLLRQHRNFNAIHEEDKFGLKYMEDIGHYDFGKNLRPVDFNNWFSSMQTHDPETIVFWLKYWNASYRYLLDSNSSHVKFLAYEDFYNNPEKHLEQLGILLNVNNVELLMESAGRVKSPEPYPEDDPDTSQDVLQECNALFDELVKHSRQ